ncbi:transmembrane and coiled-coil domain-containing protein 6 isoform X3 [Tympanuchus pallidicinctus]|uniref:transmembrane and coiled-coil domain-containing protein 6 isoform X3 n=1 Tax=Tympanuchus pallidicinctus TaxID=109042 RepID=UPI002286FB1B|nr:transmembrane and coiled-coil domain-containing protein 6 isoform X3 [Tympanuchus pallidicinctus]
MLPWLRRASPSPPTSSPTSRDTASSSWDSLEVSVPTFSVEQDCPQCWPSCGFAWPSLGTPECGDPKTLFPSCLCLPGAVLVHTGQPGRGERSCEEEASASGHYSSAGILHPVPARGCAGRSGLRLVTTPPSQGSPRRDHSVGSGLCSPPAHASTDLLWPQVWDRSRSRVCMVPPLHCFHTANVELMSLGAVPALTSLLCDIASEISPSDSEGLELLICPVLRCLGNLLAEETGREAQPQDERLLVALFIIMHCYLQQHPFLIPESLWLLNNLTADEPFFCSALLSMDLLPALLQLLPHSQTVSMLVLTVLCNIAEKGPAYCQQLHQQAALPLLLHVLVVPDPEVVGQCLELLHLLFLHWPQVAADFVKQGGHQTLEQHQSTPELQERVRVLLEMALQPLGAPAFSSSSAALSTFSQMT